ncbi:MAG: apolipoprotein N-acyltransferase [Phycisphaerae bacterium]
MSAKTDQPRTSSTEPAPGSPQRWRGWLVALGLMLLSGALLTLAQPPMDLWPLAYVSLVPFLLATRRIRSARGVILAGWVTGVLFWAVNLHWLSWVTPWGVGYIAAVLYLAVYWPVTALLMRAAFRAGWATWVTLPIFWVALEFARAYVISGFPWFFLAHTQWQQTVLIQIADATGVYGVSFFVAMVNGLACDALLAWRARRAGPAGDAPSRRSLIAGLVVAGTLLAGLLGYGFFRRMETHGAARPGPVVAVVQRAFPISLWHDTSRMEMIEEYYRSTRYELASAIDPNVGCDLVVWPETILPAGLNREFLTMDMAALSDEDVAALGGRSVEEVTPEQIERGRVGLMEQQEGLRSLAGQIARLARRLGCPILAGGSTIHHRPDYPRAMDRWRIRNSVVLFDGNDLPAEGVYSKMHLVPFSEYVPFRESAPGVHRTLRWFVPDVMSQLDYGREVRLFPVVGQNKRAGGEWSAATPICYEGTFGRVCREMVMSEGGKRADILLNLSNDGWFAFPTGRDEWSGSAEHPQHLAHYVFRAIETRCPVVRSVNTGVSASISSEGELLSVLSQDGRWAMVTGVLLLDGRDSGGVVQRGPQVLVDRRVTLYSVFGDGFAIVVGLSALGAMVALIVRGKRGSSRRNGVT